MKYHIEAKKMALIKLHRAMEEEDSDPLTPFFQWITINYTLSDRQKTVLLQKAIEKKNGIGRMTQLPNRISNSRSSIYG